jgi:hypothetical protein
VLKKIIYENGLEVHKESIAMSQRLEGATAPSQAHEHGIYSAGMFARSVGWGFGLRHPIQNPVTEE